MKTNKLKDKKVQQEKKLQKKIMTNRKWIKKEENMEKKRKITGRGKERPGGEKRKRD